jgi:threonine dehydrogenase-like Zn-dependent dehydrogenase
MDTAAGAQIVASLVLDLQQRLPLVHLARIAADVANTRESVYALAFPLGTDGNAGDERNPRWTSVGYLNLDATDVERVLLAGLCVLAIKQVREAAVQIGDPVLVFGADPWSLLLLQWARLQGASPLAFAGPRSGLLSETASSVGSDVTLVDPSPQDIARAVKRTYRAAGFAVALDAIATEQSMTQALSALRDGGRYVLAGIDPNRHVNLNAYPDLHRRDLEIVSTMYSDLELDVARMFRLSLDLADQGRLRLNGLLDPAFGWRATVTGNA